MAQVFNYAPPQSGGNSGIAGSTFNYAPPSASTAAPPQAPGFLGNVLGGIKAVGGDIAGAVTGAFQSAPSQDALSKPGNAPNDTVNTLITNLTNAGNQMKNGIEDVIANHKLVSGNPSGAIGAANVGLGAINAAFAPVNAVITYAQHVPGLGYLASGLNALFGAIGVGGADTAEGAVSALPIPQATKDQIMPVAKQAGALVAQIVAGKVGTDGLHTLADHTKTILDAVNDGVKGAQAMSGVRDVPVSGESVTTPVKLNYAPPETVATPAKPVVPSEATPQVAEPPVFRSGSQAGNIDALKQKLDDALTHQAVLEDALSGHPGKDLVKYQSTVTGELPEINSSGKGKFNKRGDVLGQDIVGQEASGGGDIETLNKHLADYRSLRSEKVGVDNTVTDLRKQLADTRKLDKNPMLARDTSPEALSLDKSAQMASPTELGNETTRLASVEGTGETKTRGLSAGVEAKAIEDKLARSLGDLPQYKTLNMADQAAKALKIVDSDYETAKRIAMGTANPPEGLHPEAVFTALEERAKAKGDVLTIKDLAHSNLATEATTMGQRIRALGERDEHSPVEAIKEVQKAREEALTKRGASIKSDATARIKDAIRKTNTKENWSDFIKSIEC